MPDVQVLVNEFIIKLKKRKVEGSQATARMTAELLRSVISQQRVPYNNQAGALIDAIKAVGEQLIAANPVGYRLSMELMVLFSGFHTWSSIEHILWPGMGGGPFSCNCRCAGLNLSAVSDDEDDGEREDHPVLSAAAVAAAARSTLRPPSLQTLLEDMPDSAAVPQSSSSGGDSEGKSKSADKSSRSRKLKHDIIEAVNELIQDIATCHEQISEQAVEHIHQKYLFLKLEHTFISLHKPLYSM
ncbi:hypothetical protein CK203_060294 [Vitis vinifera]|uniref:Uncharacterized protein n=1 Tax=Vitis vinifera TaxID=29760 RepID=A0A438GDJ3_VITVI|nr:hypothetical protein CK203_060294 [Vitis vinifera]